MENYSYTLEPYKGKDTRYLCPNCKQKDRSFARYINRYTREYLHPNVGKCNHDNSCNYHYRPKEYFKDNNIPFDKKEYIPQQKLIKNPQPETSYIDESIFKKTLQGYEKNNFVQWLIKIVGDEVITRTIELYNIGTSKHWYGANIFWQVDINGKVHTGKIMQYNAQTGKRVKEPYNKLTWVHSLMRLPKFTLKQCFFGEHLMKDNNKTVAVTESEKSAVISSIYFPEYTWIACGGLEGLNIDKCKVLRGKRVILFPDANCFEKWNKKAKQLRTFCKGVFVSDFIEKNATGKERQSGIDIADILVRFSPFEFINIKI